MLSTTRIAMFLLISFIYGSSAWDSNRFAAIYSIAAGICFLINHVLVIASFSNKYKIWLITIDCILSACFGFIFPGSNLYLILFGVAAVTLFIYTAKKEIRWTFIGFFLVVWAGIMVYSHVVLGEIDFIDNIMSAMFIVFGSIVGGLIRKLMDAKETMDKQYEQLTNSHAALSAAHEQLHSYSKQIEELTMTRERNRMAREIHDTVGHKMTALLIQIELVKEMLDIDPEKAEETILVCDSLARSALEEIRFSVRTIRTEEGGQQALIPSLRKLMEEFYKTTGLETSFEIKGDPSMIPMTLHLSIIRTVQESLTNARRHGEATACSIKLNCSKELVSLILEDNGQGTGKISKGFGLINMKERIEEHGGSIQFVSKANQGFQVKAVFPLLAKKWAAGGKQ
ncbi:sensor histidine kinase [Metabacillus sp. RGM 3146]|uniref:sensor histidine kinase n=1 Tax=Metabacillus sp. RGM 3146 TaxID=3401092 RepID=UPI003B9D834F